MSVSVAILSVAVLMGQATPPPSPPAGSAAAPAAPPPAKQAPADPPPPSLDDALGIGGGERADQPPSAIEESLSGAKPRDILQSALDDMARSADLLDSKEAGLPTRRAQQSVVRKLDELIATARRMQQEQQQQQQQQAGQSGGAQQRRNQQGRQQQDGQSGQGPGQDEPRPGADDKSRRRAGDRDGAGRPQGQRADSGAQEPPEAVDPTDQMAQFDESRAEWGRLPPRVREAVRQGLRDPMSAAYRRLTQDYYRRLAEEQRR